MRTFIFALVLSASFTAHAGSGDFRFNVTSHSCTAMAADHEVKSLHVSIGGELTAVRINDKVVDTTDMVQNAEAGTLEIPDKLLITLKNEKSYIQDLKVNNTNIKMECTSKWSPLRRVH